MSGQPTTRSDATRPHPPLVVIKAGVPTNRAGLIRRDELISRMCDERDRRITLVQAPAGYGKSTTLMQWAQADPVRRFAWLTLEETENDPALFWRYLLLALETLSPGFAGLSGGLDQPQPDPEEVIAHVLNRLIDVAGRLVLVLDDYHVIANRECHESVQYFLDHLPRSTQIAFGTRTRPPLALSKHEADGRLLAVDRSALRFTREETSQVVDKAGRRLNSEEVSRIHRDTEGWPVGVYLASRDDARGSATPGAAAARTYLREQMLDQLSDDERSLLATWSILRHLSPDLCNRVADRTDSAARLERLSDANLLLIPLDTSGDWYRFHDLLGDVLRREFVRLPVDQQKSAHRRAMEWWLEHEDVPQSIHHAIDAGEHQIAGQVLCANWYDYMLNGWLESLVRWIDRLPTQAMVDYPPILLAATWIASFTGDVKATRAYLAAAHEATYDGAMPDGSTSYASALAILRAALGHDGMVDANKHAELAYRLEVLEGPWKPTAMALAGVTRFGLGQHADARRALAEAAGAQSGPEALSVYARGQLALLEMSIGNWEEGSRQAELACDMITESDLGALLSSGAALTAAAAVAAHLGDRHQALECLRRLAPIQRVLSDAIPFDALQINLVAAESYLVIGDHRAAAIHARAATSHLEAFGDGGVFEERLQLLHQTLARSEHADDRPHDEVERLTDRERQILTMLQSDRALREIGNELYISRNTTKTHVANLYRKLGVTSRTAAIARARELNLI